MLGPIKLYLGTRFLGGLRTLLAFAVFDTKVFTARCTRSAYVSKAHGKDVPVHEIMAKAGWSVCRDLSQI